RPTPEHPIARARELPAERTADAVTLLTPEHQRETWQAVRAHLGRRPAGAEKFCARSRDATHGRRLDRATHEDRAVDREDRSGAHRSTPGVWRRTTRRPSDRRRRRHTRWGRAASARRHSGPREVEVGCLTSTRRL